MASVDLRVEPLALARPAGKRRGAIRALAVVIVVVLGAELGVRIAAGHLPSPQRWPAPEAQHKADQLSGFGRSDVVVFGASMADDGIDPAIVDARLGRRHAAYNAALVGTPLESVSLWAEHYVVPRLHPRVVILGLSPVELNGNIPGGAASNRAFRDAPAARQALGTESLWQRATRIAGAISALVRYRSVLRSPSSLLRGRQNGENGLAMVNDPPLTASGLNVTEYDDPYNVFLGRPVTAQVRHDELAGDLFRDFAVTTAKVVALRQLVAALEASGARVVIVDMPMTGDAVSYLPHGAVDVRATADALSATASAEGATFLPTGIWPSTYFGDPVHLNGRGSAALTTALIPTIVGLLYR